MSTTNTPDQATHDASSKPWWERLTDSSADEKTGRNLAKLTIVAFAVMALAIFGWKFFQNSKIQAADQLVDVMRQGQELLPDEFPRGRYGVTDASSFYFMESNKLYNRKTPWSALSDRVEAKAYLDKVETVLGTFDDKAKDFAGTDREWEFKLTRMELRWFAALNSLDPVKRKEHLKAQLALIAELASGYPNHPVLTARPDPDEPDATLLDLWKTGAEAELAFLDKHAIQTEVRPDEGLKATLTLENGQVVELEFYSVVAPKSVAAFVTNARAGFYDSTAFHGVDPEAGTITGGDPLTRLVPNRKFVWHKGDPGYGIPSESNSLLPVEKGSVTLERTGAWGHGFHFVIHVKEPAEPVRGETVFAKVTRGLEALEEWLQTEVHDEAGLENPHLPRLRLGLQKAEVVGTIQHPSDDSWAPAPRLPETPEVSDAETEWVKALAPGDEGPKKDEDQPKKDEDQ